MGSNLLYKASIVTTPTAYGVGVLNSIKPAIPFGDELIVNGNFTTDSDWTKGTGWTISGGKANSDGSQSTISDLEQNITLNQGLTYLVEFDLIRSSGTLYPKVGDTTGTGLTSTQSVSQTIVAGSSNKLELRADANFIGSIDNVSVKEVTDADFQFSRTSSATRVNPDYLIETVSINSDELVQNGNFSELGAEEIVNPTFNTSSFWEVANATADNYVEFINGQARLKFLNTSPITQLIAQGFTYQSGKTYKLVVDIASVESGDIKIDASGISETFNTAGVNTRYITPTGNGNIAFYRASSNVDITLNSVSVKQVDPNDNWVVGTGWSYGTNEIIHSSGTGSASRLKQLGFNNTSLYKVTITITNKGANSYRIFNGAGSSVSLLEGTNTYLVTGLLAGQLIIDPITHPGGDVEFSNISVIEIQENGVPRLDYTNGTASILLEPQSTNSIKFSEPTSSETSAGGITYESYIWAIGHFTNCIKFGDNSQTRYRYFTTTIANSTQYVISAFVIMDDLSEPVLGTNTVSGDFILRVGGQSASTGNLPNVNMGNNIYRVSSVITSSASGGTTGLLKYAGQSNKGFRIVGFQAEALSYASSYIPTNGAVVTRAAETLNNAANSDLINSTEGVLYAEIAALANVSGAREITISDGSTSNRVMITYPDANNIRVNYRVGASNIFDQQYPTTLTNFNKIAIKWKLNDFSFYANGIEIASSSSGSVMSANTLNTLNFDNATGSEDFYGKCKTVAVFKEALSDTELACLTSTSNREIFLNYYYRMQYVGANTEALSCAEQTFNI